jgi:hypothetical protein
MKDEPLFRSVRQALSFAYAITEFSIMPVARYGVPEGSTQSSAAYGMTAHDWHAQGALIRRMVEQRLTGAHLHFTLAEYGHGQLKQLAIKEIARHIGASIRKPGLGRELVYRHFGAQDRRLSQQQLAKQFDLSQSTISRLDIEIRDQVVRLSNETEAMLHQKFVVTGLCESV